MPSLYRESAKGYRAEVTDKTPPKTHNLLYLTKLVGINFPEKLFEFVSKINNVSIVTRYPEDFSKLIDVYPENIAKKYFVQAKEVLAWLRQHEKLTK